MHQRSSRVVCLLACTVGIASCNVIHGGWPEAVTDSRHGGADACAAPMKFSPSDEQCRGGELTCINGAAGTFNKVRFPAGVDDCLAAARTSCANAGLTSCASSAGIAAFGHSGSSADRICWPATRPTTESCKVRVSSHIFLRIWDEDGALCAVRFEGWLDKGDVREVRSPKGRVRYMYRYREGDGFSADTGTWCHKGETRDLP